MLVAIATTASAQSPDFPSQIQPTLPAMVNERKGQVKDRERLAALASWVEAVRDMLAAASGIEEAIVRSAETLTPDSPIRQPISRLRGTTEALGLREGLRRFGIIRMRPIRPAH